MKAPSHLIRGCSLLIVLLAALWAGPVAAAECTSKQNGLWSNPTTWNCPGGPTSADDVVIAHNVTLTNHESVRNLTIDSGATLNGHSAAKTLFVSGNWTNNGTFVANSQTVNLNASGSSGADAEQTLTGDTVFYRLSLSGSNSNKHFGSSQVTILNQFSNSGGTMNPDTSTFVFENNSQINDGTGRFHNLTIQGSFTHVSTSGIYISGNFEVNSAGSFTSDNGRTVYFNGNGNNQVVTLNGSASLTNLVIVANAVVTLPDVGSTQFTAASVTNNGVLRQSGSASGPTEFVYIRDSSGTAVYQGLDLEPTSGSINATVVVAGNKTACNNPNGGSYRNRCFGVASDAAVSATVTLYTLGSEDDITDDAFFQYAGSNTWTNQGACASPTNTGNPCTATVTLTNGNNAFLIARSSTPPTPVTLTTFTLTRTDSANHLAWETATEVNFAGFYVQRRSADGDFARASDFIYAQGGPLSGAAYTWTDSRVDGGPYTYRLEAVDFDQSVEFFDLTHEESSNTPAATHTVYLPLSLK